MKQNQKWKDGIKQRRNIIQDTLTQLGNQLEKGYSAEMTQYLKKMVLFHQYSFSNQLLIMNQRPEATHVAGFHTWKRLNRSIKAREKAIRIFAPFTSKRRKPLTKQDARKEPSNTSSDDGYIYSFRTVCVFDISQTHGENLPEPLRAMGDAKQCLAILEKAIRKQGVRLECGYTGQAEVALIHGKRTLRTVSVRNTLELVQAVFFPRSHHS